MKRKIYDDLVKWKETSIDTPLMIIGARQIGKTYVINEFCKNEFKNYFGVNLFERTDIVELYESKQNANEKYIQLLSLCNIQTVCLEKQAFASTFQRL